MNDVFSSVLCDNKKAPAVSARQLEAVLLLTLNVRLTCGYVLAGWVCNELRAIRGLRKHSIQLIFDLEPTQSVDCANV